MGPGTIATIGATADIRIAMWPLVLDDFDRVVEAGILGDDQRFEPLTGRLSAMSSPSPPCAGLLQWLATELIQELDRGIASVRVRSPLRFGPRSEPEPDLAIVPAARYVRAHPTGAMLVIEIAMTSRAIDLGTRAEIYAVAQVDEYWVVDIAARTVHVHAAPAAGAYTSARRVTSGDLRPAVPGAPPIDVQTLFSLLD